MSAAEEVPVLIVGAGLAGLSAAVFLSAHGVACQVVERATGPSPLPRFRGLTVRSMELFRSVGLSGAIERAGTPGGDIGGIARVRNLSAPGAVWETAAWEDDAAGLSPADACACDQNVLEPILAEHAVRHGAVLRYGVEVTGLQDGEPAALVRLRERASGAESVVPARYVIAADGAGSTVRRLLGVARHGPGVLGHQVSVVFEAELAAELEGRRFGACYVEDVGGALLPRDGGLWQLSVSYDPDRGEGPQDFTEERCLRLIETALGRPEPTARVRGVGPWDVAAAVADRFRAGRVFLAGDAAHVMPPSGGFGGNTGIQDVHNLAWKLAAVLDGTAGTDLLDSYDQERRPVADLTLVHALARMPLSWLAADGAAPPPLPPQLPHNTVSLGYLYPPHPGGGGTENPREPSGRPGSRAAHLPVETAGGRTSTLDLFGPGWTLLTSAPGWSEAVAKAAADRPGLRLSEHRAGPGGDVRDLTGRWATAFGTGRDGATLVRPDGFVAWRAQALPADPAAELSAALAGALMIEGALRAWSGAEPASPPRTPPGTPA
ncbi:FAD-dependent monooxygenase [Nonomuraea sp. NPDC050310]|uniref:FAD-dependent monooxygenase n=1 Tax=Nonomuraea sp. NPDC050310 TaxID=3154935 RepID=UPI0033D4D645